MLASLVTVGAALALAALQSALASAHLGVVRQLDDAALTALSLRLKRARPAERAALLRSSDVPVARALGEALEASPGDPEGALDLELGELEHRLERTAGWPEAAVRIVVLGTMLVVLAGFGAGAHTLALGAAFVIGMTGALVSMVVGRAARERGRRARAAVDALVDAMLGARPSARAGREPSRQRRGVERA